MSHVGDNADTNRTSYGRNGVSLPTMPEMYWLNACERDSARIVLNISVEFDFLSSYCRCRMDGFACTTPTSARSGYTSTYILWRCILRYPHMNDRPFANIVA